MKNLASLLAGALFGLGLIVSGMANPDKVLGFLDITARWDPSLALVMAGAVGVGLVAFAWARRRSAAVLGGEMHMPTARGIDHRLLGGSVLFGIGWGVAGFCPGPAWVALGMGEAKALLFVAAMLVGMGAFEVFEGLARRRRAALGTL